MDLIVRAAQFAKYAHSSQRRKYTGIPFIAHPMRVAGRTALTTGMLDRDVAAAWMHDVVEDHPTFKELMLSEFRPEVTDLVMELTNAKSPALLSDPVDPGLNRAARKAKDRQRLAGVSIKAKRIKLIDRIDNIADIPARSDFLQVYLAESQLLLDECLRGADNDLEQELQGLINTRKEQLSRG